MYVFNKFSFLINNFYNIVYNLFFKIINKIIIIHVPHPT